LKQCAVYQDTRAVAPAVERRKPAELPPWLLSTIVADRTGLECDARMRPILREVPLAARHIIKTCASPWR